MTLSIVIPAYNEEKYLADCLKSCVQFAPKNLREVIVVDNASTDGTAELAKQYAPLVRVVSQPKKGLTHARQAGFEAAKGDIMISIDADTRIASKDWFDAIQKKLSEPGVVCVSGPYVLYDAPKWKRPLVAAYWGLSGLFTNLFTGYLVVGGNWAASRAAIQKIGGFDTSIEFYGEDTDIGRRMKKIGKVVYSSKCWIYSSARRVNAEGLIMPSIVYILNYFWIALFHKPFTTKHRDIR